MNKKNKGDDYMKKCLEKKIYGVGFIIVNNDDDDDFDDIDYTDLM